MFSSFKFNLVFWSMQARWHLNISISTTRSRTRFWVDSTNSSDSTISILSWMTSIDGVIISWLLLTIKPFFGVASPEGSSKLGRVFFLKTSSEAPSVLFLLTSLEGFEMGCLCLTSKSFLKTSFFDLTSTSRFLMTSSLFLSGRFVLRTLNLLRVIGLLVTSASTGRGGTDVNDSLNWNSNVFCCINQWYL